MQAFSVNYLGSPYYGSMKTGRPCKQREYPFGARLHAAREALGLSQAEVADKLGINQASYGAWERDPVALRPEQIQKLAEVLSVSVEHLFGEDEKKQHKGGPVGKARRIFEELSKIPRSQQTHVLTVVEGFVRQYANGHAAKAS
jgi:transcriptional regulator with XRE-family HTH domain